MELYRALLAGPRLSVISAEPDADLARMAAAIAPSVRVGGPAELDAVLDGLVLAGAGAAAPPRTLDLFGHSTPGAALLRLGSWVVDAGDPAVAAWFRRLAARRVLPRLGIRALRLLGCRTADTPAGRATMAALAALTGVEVHGMTQLLYDAHHDAHGFRRAWEFLLVSSRDLALRVAPAGALDPGPRRLALEALPAQPLAPPPAGWPRRLATWDTMAQIARLVRCDAGAPMPRPAIAPSCELAWPAAAAGAYHVAEVVLGGAFVRFYPDGAAGPGVAYPVDDAPALRRIVDALPVTRVSR